MLETRLASAVLRGLLLTAAASLLSGCISDSHDAPAAAQTVLAAPTNLAANPGSATVTLSWTASAGAASYNVKRGTTNGGPYTQLATPTSTSYTDTTVTNGTTYYYVVSAVDASGESGNSSQVSATFAAANSATPAGLRATSGNVQVVLNWTASAGATGYNVKRATVSGGPYTQVGTPTSTSYTDTSVTNGTKYFYVITAVTSAGESANSTEVSATPAAPNPPPASVGAWINVTPSGVDLTSNLSCNNYGTQSVQVDPAHPGTLYTQFHCQGIWKSTDYGVTWTGPVNTGANAAAVKDCAGGIAVVPSTSASVATIFEACIRGSGLGVWKSVDGGVNWTHINISPTSRQDYWPPVFDPYDTQHLLMSAHEFDSLVQSVDGGQTWTAVPLNNGMLQNGGTGYLFFIDTGTAASTRSTWLWIGQSNGGRIGTWRTTNSGSSWTMVDKNEHIGGTTQIYQPDTNGVLYMTGGGSVFGSGVLRSQDFGQTWAQVGMNTAQSVVLGSSKNVYAMFGAPVGPNGSINASFEVASQPGNGVWIMPGTPAALTQGPAQINLVNDGTHNILLAAMWNLGVWRYVEP